MKKLLPSSLLTTLFHVSDMYMEKAVAGLYVTNRWRKDHNKLEKVIHISRTF